MAVAHLILTFVQKSAPQMSCNSCYLGWPNSDVMSTSEVDTVVERIKHLSQLGLSRAAAEKPVDRLANWDRSQHLTGSCCSTGSALTLKP